MILRAVSRIDVIEKVAAVIVYAAVKVLREKKSTVHTCGGRSYS